MSLVLHASARYMKTPPGYIYNSWDMFFSFQTTVSIKNNTRLECIFSANRTAIPKNGFLKLRFLSTTTQQRKNAQSRINNKNNFIHSYLNEFSQRRTEIFGILHKFLACKLSIHDYRKRNSEIYSNSGS